MVEVPQAFVDMPRWWHDSDGRRWLDNVSRLAAEQCDRWSLEVDGPCWHGTNALVVPVRRGNERLALRLCPPRDDVAAEARALQVWDGHGTVELVEVEPASGAMLLERLEGSRSLLDEPLDTALPVLGALMRELAISVPSDVTSTAELAAQAAASFEREWREVSGPTSTTHLAVAIDSARARAGEAAGSLAVNGDLHYQQVLKGIRMPWLVVDPVLLRGDVEYDLGRILWTRLDEMPERADVIRAFDTIVEVAEVPRCRAASWVVVRAMAYLLWGLRRGLTFDPPRCQRLLEIFG